MQLEGTVIRTQSCVYVKLTSRDNFHFSRVVSKHTNSSFWCLTNNKKKEHQFQLPNGNFFWKQKIVYSKAV